MLIGIDGTGPAEDGVYEKHMKGSFVRTLLSDYAGRGTMYFRGPTASGLECSDIAERAMIAARVALKANDSLHLAGYSRGGAIAIRVAQLVKREFPGTQINVMALFDAVDRTPQFDASLIPGNVARAYHAVRAAHVGSRDWFGNCGLSAEPPCHLEILEFATTHGGMGGVPFADPDATGVLDWLKSDTATMNLSNNQLRMSDLVYKWMRGSLRRDGVLR